MYLQEALDHLKSLSVIVSTGYHLLLAFFSVSHFFTVCNIYTRYIYIWHVYMCDIYLLCVSTIYIYCVLTAWIPLTLL